MGRGREVDHQKTDWYRTPIKEDSVRTYLESFVDARHEFLAALAKLKALGPKNLDECYLYYKYLVRGNLQDMGMKSFLSDWDKFSSIMRGHGDKTWRIEGPGNEDVNKQIKDMSERVRDERIGPKGTFKVGALYPHELEKIGVPLSQYDKNRQANGIMNLEDALDRYIHEDVPELRDKKHDWQHGGGLVNTLVRNIPPPPPPPGPGPNHPARDQGDRGGGDDGDSDDDNPGPSDPDARTELPAPEDGMANQQAPTARTIEITIPQAKGKEKEKEKGDDEERKKQKEPIRPRWGTEDHPRPKPAPSPPPSPPPGRRPAPVPGDGDTEMPDRPQPPQPVAPSGPPAISPEPIDEYDRPLPPIPEAEPTAVPGPNPIPPEPITDFGKRPPPAIPEPEPISIPRPTPVPSEPIIDPMKRPPPAIPQPQPIPVFGPTPTVPVEDIFEFGKAPPPVTPQAQPTPAIPIDPTQTPVKPVYPPRGNLTPEQEASRNFLIDRGIIRPKQPVPPTPISARDEGAPEGPPKDVPVPKEKSADAIKYGISDENIDLIRKTYYDGIIKGGFNAAARKEYEEYLDKYPLARQIATETTDYLSRYAGAPPGNYFPKQPEVPAQTDEPPPPVPARPEQGPPPLPPRPPLGEPPSGQPRVKPVAPPKGFESPVIHVNEDTGLVSAIPQGNTPEAIQAAKVLNENLERGQKVTFERMNKLLGDLESERERAKRETIGRNLANERLEGMQSAIHLNQTARQEALNSAQQLQSELDGVRRQLAEKEASGNLQQGEREELSKSANLLQSMVHDLQSRNQLVAQTAENQAAEINRIKQERDEHISRLTQQHEAQVGELTRTIDNSRAALEGLSKDREVIHGERAIILQEAFNLDATVKAQKARIAELEKIDQANKERAEQAFAAGNERIKQLEKQLAEGPQPIIEERVPQELLDENKELRTKAGRADAELVKLRRELEVSTQQREQLDNRLKENTRRGGNVENELHQTKRQLDELSQQKSDLKRNLDLAVQKEKTAREEKEREALESRAIHESLTKEIEKQKSETARLHEELNKALDEKEKLRKETSLAKKKSKTETAESVREVSALKQQKSAIDDTYNKTRRELGEANEQIKLLKAQLDASTTAQGFQLNQIARYSKSQSDLTRALETARESLRDLKNKGSLTNRERQRQGSLTAEVAKLQEKLNEERQKNIFRTPLEGRAARTFTNGRRNASLANDLERAVTAVDEGSQIQAAREQSFEFADPDALEGVEKGVTNSTRSLKAIRRFGESLDTASKQRELQSLVDRHQQSIPGGKRGSGELVAKNVGPELKQVLDDTLEGLTGRKRKARDLSPEEAGEDEPGLEALPEAAPYEPSGKGKEKERETDEPLAGEPLLFEEKLGPKKKGRAQEPTNEPIPEKAWAPGVNPAIEGAEHKRQIENTRGELNQLAQKNAEEYVYQLERKEKVEGLTKTEKSALRSVKSTLKKGISVEEEGEGEGGIFV